MNKKSQLLILFTFLSVISFSAYTFFSNSDDEILQETNAESLKELTTEEITTTTEMEKKFNYPGAVSYTHLRAHET